MQDDKESLDYYYAAKRLVLLIAMPVQMATLTVISSIPDLYARRNFPNCKSCCKQRPSSQPFLR
ncbi:MAG: hypothetical protein U0894_08370 [Pirellulales bacterium]